MTVPYQLLAAPAIAQAGAKLAPCVRVAYVLGLGLPALRRDLHRAVTKTLTAMERLSTEARREILGTNAMWLYGLRATRPTKTAPHGGEGTTLRTARARCYANAVGVGLACPRRSPRRVSFRTDPPAVL